MINLSDNLFALTGCDPDREIVRALLQCGGVRVERILSTGQASPEGFWYDQDESEWVALLSGEAVLEYPDGERQTLQAGDSVFLPAHRRHRVVMTSNPAVWLAVFFPAGGCA